ncbi:MAG: Rv3212 family protein [Pseudonocardiaceae bacterium]
MPAAERRTRGDLVAAAILTVVVLVIAAALWWTSDTRRTILVTATGPAPQAPAQRPLPAALAEIWRAPSPATPVPVVQGGTVVTGAGGEVAGRDLGSGAIRWSYRRDLPLCTVAAALNRVAALYQRGEHCSEVTTLRWADGGRGPQRNGPVEAPTRLVADGDQAATAGRRYLEVWRSDLVRTLSYGRLPTPAQPATQPRPDCTHGSMALDSGRLAVIERCPAETSARLTVQRSHPKEPDQPEVDFSTPMPGDQARVIALTPRRVAVALPGPPRLLVFDARGNQVAEHPLTIPDADLRGDPPAGPAMVTSTPVALYWFTGSTTIALDAATLRPRWTRLGARGPGCLVAGRLLVPTQGALSVLDTRTAEQVAALPVDRGGYLGPVVTATSGDVVLEQRGDTLVALG